MQSLGAYENKIKDVYEEVLRFADSISTQPEASDKDIAHLQSILDGVIPDNESEREIREMFRKLYKINNKHKRANNLLNSFGGGCEHYILLVDGYELALYLKINLLVYIGWDESKCGFIVRKWTGEYTRSRTTSRSSPGRHSPSKYSPNSHSPKSPTYGKANYSKPSVIKPLQRELKELKDAVDDMREIISLKEELKKFTDPGELKEIRKIKKQLEDDLAKTKVKSQDEEPCDSDILEMIDLDKKQDKQDKWGDI